MSVVVVRHENNKLVMGADSMITLNDNRKAIHPGAKIYKNKNVVIGSAGGANECMFMEVYLKTFKRFDFPNDRESMVEFYMGYEAWVRDTMFMSDFTSDNDFVMIYNDKAWAMLGYWVTEITDFFAIGSGQDFAIGALHAGATTKEALEIACSLSPYCALPLTIYSVNKEKFVNKEK